MHRFVRYALISLYTSAALVGCHRLDDASSVYKARDVPPTTRASQRELQAAGAFLLGHMGLDPQGEYLGIVKDVPGLFRTVSAIANEHNYALQVIEEPRELLNAVSSRKAVTGVLIANNARIYEFLGIVRNGQDVFVQLALPEHPPFLTRLSHPYESAWSRGWLINGREEPPVHLAVGSGRLSVNKLLQNFGLVAIDEALSTEFVMTNEGHTSLELRRALSSCSCAVPDFDKPYNLEPGESKAVRVDVKRTQEPAFRYSLWLDVADLETDASRLLRFALTGIRERPMEVQPSSLDFGSILGGETAVRTVRIAETEFSPLHLEGVEVRDVPVSCLIEVTERGHLSEYVLTFELDAAALPSGSYSGDALIRTDSAQQPQISIPIQFQKLSYVRSIPATVSFGRVAIGQRGKRKVELSARDGEWFEIVEVDSREECPVRCSRVGDAIELSIEPNFLNAGLWERKLYVTARSSEWSERIEISCVGLVMVERET